MHGLACSNQHVPVKHRSGPFRVGGSGSLAKFTAIQRSRKNDHSTRACPQLGQRRRYLACAGSYLNRKRNGSESFAEHRFLMPVRCDLGFTNHQLSDSWEVGLGRAHAIELTQGIRELAGHRQDTGPSCSPKPPLLLGPLGAPAARRGLITRFALERRGRGPNRAWQRRSERPCTRLDHYLRAPRSPRCVSQFAHRYLMSATGSAI